MPVGAMDNTSHLSLKVKKEPDYLYVQPAGHRIRKALFEIAVNIVKIADEYQYTRILVDITRLSGHLNTIDIYDLARRDLSSLKQVVHKKIAVLDAQLDQLTDNLQFFETVCRNTGLNIRVFTVMDDAVQWLRSDTYL